MDASDRHLIHDVRFGLERAWAGRWRGWTTPGRHAAALHDAWLPLIQVATRQDTPLPELEAALADLEAVCAAAEPAWAPGLRAWRMWEARDRLRRALAHVQTLDDVLQAGPKGEIPPLGPSSERRARVGVPRQSGTRVISAG